MASPEAIASIRRYLKDILGSESVFSDDIIVSYIRKFSGRIDAVQYALDSLLEDYYNAPQGYYSAPHQGYFNAPQDQEYQNDSNAPMNRGAGGSSSVSESFREFCKLPFFKKVCTL